MAMTSTAHTGELHAPDREVEAARSGWTHWRTSRLASVVAATGNLSLVQTRWFESDAAAPSAREALVGQPDTVSATLLQRKNLVTGAPEQGIRLWDAASPSILNFDTITAWDFNPAWVVSAVFTPVDVDRTIPFEHIRDNGGTRDLVVPGDITFTLDGVDYTFSAFDDDGTLLLVFGDASNGASGVDGSYEAGRFLFVHREATDFGVAGGVVLDFNRAFVPPCGFSIHYNCPLPPRNNRFSFPVEAGEKAVVFKGGHTLY
jgi:uncharacterized protein (DUF1684 family)